MINAWMSQNVWASWLTQLFLLASTNPCQNVEVPSTSFRIGTLYPEAKWLTASLSNALISFDFVSLYVLRNTRFVKLHTSRNVLSKMKPQYVQLKNVNTGRALTQLEPGRAIANRIRRYPVRSVTHRGLCPHVSDLRLIFSPSGARTIQHARRIKNRHLNLKFRTHEVLQQKHHQETRG